MPRRHYAEAGSVFHVMNRGARRARLFDGDKDYRLFLACVSLGLDRVPIRLLAYCVMPNHFHFVVWPRQNGDLSRFMKLVTATHAMRWHRLRGSQGTGCLYQGRYRAVAVQQDQHFLTVCRYVERNALRAHLVGSAEDWPWSSLHQRFRNCHTVQLDEWPVPQPTQWVDYLNQESASESRRVRRAIATSQPIGSAEWAMNAPGAIRAQGRPPKTGPHTKQVGTVLR